jgi:hypothetical protein
MIRLQRYTSALPPQTVASNGTNGILVVDLRPTTGVRFEAAEFNILVGPGASTAAPITLQLMESVDTNASNYATVSGFVGGTNSAGGFTLPSIATSAGSGFHVAFNVNARTRKRYLKVSVVPGTTATVSIVGSLREPNNSIAASTTGSGGDVFILG